MKKNRKKLIISLGIIAALFVLSEFSFKRFDMTADKRFTLSPTSKNILERIDEPLDITLLLGGQLPGDYRTLKNEISFLLDEFKNINPKITYRFVDPLKEYSPLELDEWGLFPAPVRTDKGILNVYPYALLKYGDREIWMETLFNDPALSLSELPLASAEKLEYIFLDDIRTITRIDRKNVGFLVHHDELPEMYMDGFGRALADHYNVDVFIRPIQDTTYTLKMSDLEDLEHFDALISLKPTLPFTEEDKMVMDQYIMRGGKMMFLTESVDAEMDSIMRSGRIVAFPRELEMNDFFFNYGLRIIPTIVKDLEASKIILADGETRDGNVSYNFYTWPYFVQGFPAEKNPITQNINSVQFRFADPIEIMENDSIKHTVLLATSPYTTLQPALSFIELSEVGEIEQEEYQMGRIPLAVLAEGDFKSMYASRYEREEIPDFRADTKDGKIILISDGDVGKNDLRGGRPMRLGEDKYSTRPDNPNQKPRTYDNQNFLVNSVDYLLGETDFLSLKNRKLEIPTLNDTLVTLDKTKWQLINLLLPLAVIWFIGIGLILFRKLRHEI